MQFSVYPDPDNSGCDRVGFYLTLPQHGQQQQHEEQQQPSASSQASSKGGKRPQKAADDDLAASWLLSHSWGKYTGKQTPAGHRHATCSICLEHNHGVSKYGQEGEGGVVTDKSDLMNHEGSKSHRTSANMGRTSGVATKFLNLISYICAVHCIAHRSALVMGDGQNNQKSCKRLTRC